jgi:hypothetical protein
MMMIITISAAMVTRRGNTDIKMAIAMVSSKAVMKGERTIPRTSVFRMTVRQGAATGIGWARSREDAARGKPYNSRPRGRYDDEDHGYSSVYGNKRAYKAQYANGYRAGYESTRGRY